MAKPLDPKYTIGSLYEPARFDHIPDTAQWLGGTGAGGWFCLENCNQLNKGEYRMRRFSSEGILECDRVFVPQFQNEFYIDKPYKIDYISHCQKITVLQNKQTFVFVFVREY